MSSLIAPELESKAQSKSLRGGLLLIAKLTAAVGLIYWMIDRGALDLKSLKVALRPEAFAILATLVFLQLVFANWRWQVLLVGQGLIRRQSWWAGFKKTMPLTLMGLFFNYAMPGSVGGDVIKGYYLSKGLGPQGPGKKVAAGVSVLMDRLIGFFVMMLSASFAIVLFFDRIEHDARLRAIGAGTLAITGGFVLVLVISLSKRLQKPLRWVAKLFQRVPGYRVFETVYRAMHAYRSAEKDLLWALALSMMNQLLLIVFFIYAAQLIGDANIPISTFWFCIPVGLVVMSVPISPAGVGVGQAAFYFLFEAVLQRPTTVGAVGITLLQAFQFLFGLVGAAFFMRSGAVANAANGNTMRHPTEAR